MQKLMNTDCPYLTDELAYDMNIGRSTVNGDLKRLRKILEEQDFLPDNFLQFY